jgi:hypothetical protein
MHKGAQNNRMYKIFVEKLHGKTPLAMPWR